MTDRLGYRLKLGIVIPSTNTIVQPETDTMRPAGVTNHIGRIHIPDLPLTNVGKIRKSELRRAIAEKLAAERAALASGAAASQGN